MTILLWVLAVPAVALLLLFLIASARSGEFTVQRSTFVSATPGDIHKRLIDFREWKDWSPWEGIDPNMQRIYSEPSAGVDARYEWIGNDKVGCGNMKIDRVDAERSIEITLSFLKPWKATNRVLFTLQKKENGTEVSWAMSGTQAFMMKVMSVVINMDKLVGKDFEKGLSNLKRVVESASS